MKRLIIILASAAAFVSYNSSFAASAFPLTNAVLRGPMNGGGQPITNAQDVVLASGPTLSGVYAAGTSLTARVAAVETGKAEQVAFVALGTSSATRVELNGVETGLTARVSAVETGKVDRAHLADPVAHAEAVGQRVSDAAPRVVFEANLSSPFYLAAGMDYIYWDQVLADVYSAFYNGTDYVVPLELDGVTALITATFVPTSSGTSFTPLELRLMAASNTWYAYYYHSSHDGVIVPPISERQPTMTVSVIKKLTAGVHLWFEGESDLDEGTISSVDRWTITVLNPAPQERGFNYAVVSNAATITGYNGTDGLCLVPSSVYGVPVVGLASGAFDGNTNLFDLRLSSVVSNVPDTLCRSAESLTNVSFGVSVTNIGSDAFSGCVALSSVVVPASVQYLSGGAFGGCFGMTGAYFLGDAPLADAAAFYAYTGVVYHTAGAVGFTNEWAGVTNFAVWAP